MNTLIRGIILCLPLALGGCATSNPKDPFETYNRAVFNFNDAVDKAALQPAAEAYGKMPSFLQTGIGNFFGNLGDVWTAVNNLLQGKMADGMSDVMRVAFNSTFGLGGVLDLAAEAQLPKHKADLGQTLGSWGVGAGPYVMLPLLGPSTMRDAAVLPIELGADPWGYKDPIRWRNAGYATRAIDGRAELLGASRLVDAVALDRYQFVRDAYMQYRWSKVHDGESPQSAYQNKDALDAPIAGVQ
jgi:phospholipid-binding lipoprotein MlaA